MTRTIESVPFANHEAVPTQTTGNSIVYTVVGSDVKWEKKASGFRMPYVESPADRKARLDAEKQAKEDADFEERATRLGYTKA
jgi:hypothetical protein